MKRTTAATIGLIAVDAVAYAIVFAVIVVALVTPIGFVYSGWTGVKIALFLIGMAFFGYGSLRLWLGASQGHSGGQSSPDAPTVSPGQNSRLQAVLDGLPGYPAAEMPDAARLSPATKLFVGSLLVLGVSYVMEAAFGI